MKNNNEQLAVEFLTIIKRIFTIEDIFGKGLKSYTVNIDKPVDDTVDELNKRVKQYNSEFNECGFHITTTMNEKETVFKIHASKQATLNSAFITFMMLEIIQDTWHEQHCPKEIYLQSFLFKYIKDYCNQTLENKTYKQAFLLLEKHLNKEHISIRFTELNNQYQAIIDFNET